MFVLMASHFGALASVGVALLRAVRGGLGLEAWRGFNLWRGGRGWGWGLWGVWATGGVGAVLGAALVGLSAP
ncbi:hypothetical protein ASB7_03990 [Helicobacter ailurogastricus]|nr:hypothetical protein ASB7_03990 [Helicobacter ailurogastricus]